MKLQNYFYELQWRFFFFVTCIVLNSIVLSYFREDLFFLLGQHQPKLFPYFIATNLTEVFTVSLKLILFFSLYAAMPLFFTQLWFFLIPAFYEYEYRIIKKFFLLSLFFYFLITFLIFKVFLPLCWKFFTSFEMGIEKNGISIQLETKLSDYINFFFDLFILLTLASNSLLIFYFFLQKLTLDSLVKFRKLIYTILFLLATLVTPPDIGSQLVVGSFLLVTYEILLFSFFLTTSYSKL